MQNFYSITDNRNNKLVGCDICSVVRYIVEGRIDIQSLGIIFAYDSLDEKTLCEKYSENWRKILTKNQYDYLMRIKGTPLYTIKKNRFQEENFKKAQRHLKRIFESKKIYEVATSQRVYFPYYTILSIEEFKRQIQDHIDGIIYYAVSCKNEPSPELISILNNYLKLALEACCK